jgi:pilus assembly protein Flp/PilA
MAEEGTSMFNRVVSRLQQRERGATAVEYGLMVLLIALVIIGAVTAIGTTLSTVFSSVASGF